MNWTEIIKSFLELFDSPSGLAVLAIGFLLILLAYTTPMFLVTGAFVYVGDKVTTDVGKRFDRIEHLLERKEIATK